MLKTLIKGIVVVPAVFISVVGLMLALAGMLFTATGKYMLALVDE